MRNRALDSGDEKSDIAMNMHGSKLNIPLTRG